MSPITVFYAKIRILLSMTLTVAMQVSFILNRYSIHNRRLENYNKNRDKV